MSEQVLPNIYRIEVPIPHSPLKATNAYVIRGNDRVLLVDSGQNRQESLTVLKQGLAELSVDLQQTDIFLTHMHADHSGLLTFLKTDSNRIFASQEDAGRVNQMLTADNPLEPLYQAAIRNGFSPEEAGKTSSHSGATPTQRNPTCTPNCCAFWNKLMASPLRRTTWPRTCTRYSHNLRSPRAFTMNWLCASCVCH